MRFRFYLVDEDGEVTGTNDAQTAKKAADTDAYIAVINTESGVDETIEVHIPQQTTYSEG